MSDRRTVRLLALLLALAGAAPAAEEPRMETLAPRLRATAPAPLPRREVAYQRGPAAAFGGGQYLLVWQDGYNGLGGKSDILALRLDSRGRPVDGKTVPVCAQEGVQEAPGVAFCGGGFLVAWSDFRNGRDYDVYAARVDAAGNVSPENGVLLDGGPGGQAFPAVASDGRGSFLVAWQARRPTGGFEVRGMVLPAAGELKAAEKRTLMDRGELPAVVWTGRNYFVSLGQSGRLVGADGAPAGEALQMWNNDMARQGSVAAAWGRALSVFNITPSPSPWGWSGPGAVIGVSVTPEGQSPELAAAKKDRLGAPGDVAGRMVRNVVDSARWCNQNGWPSGAPGGLKGSHDGCWPSGATAAAWNGRSVIVVWTRAHFVDELRLANRDLRLRRVLDGWAPVDEPALDVAAGPTEEGAPALASDLAGGTLLAWERQLPEGGVAIDYRLLSEDEDREAPRVAWIARESDTVMRLGFDEPLDAESAARAENYAVEGVAVTAAEFERSGQALMREVALSTAAQERGRTYRLTVKGVKDLAGNAAAGGALEYLCQPGTAHRSEFVAQWLVAGPFPDGVASGADLVDPAACHPSPGDAVPAMAGEEIRAVLRKAVSDEEWGKYNLEADGEKLFGGAKAWKALPARAASLLELSEAFGKTPAACAYATTYVFSDRERDVLVRIDSNDGNRTWLNGKLLHSDPAKSGRGIHDYTNESPARLRKGWNQLLVQVQNRFGLWMLAGQIVAPDRQPLRDLTYQLENPFGEK